MIRLAAIVAARQRAEVGLVSRSVLHGLMDVVETLPQPGDQLLVDEGAYPLARWACRAAAAAGVRVSAFPHHKPPLVTRSDRTWFLTDGWCQGCNLPAPLARLQATALSTGGGVIVDDSLAFGLLGYRADRCSFGDGTSTIRWSGCNHDGFIWLASLAKAYGTPVTIITGEEAAISAVARGGSNRLHSSPPSAADVGAGLDALADNDVISGMRDRLYHLTRWLRGAFRDLGVPPQGLTFPIVGTRVPSLLLASCWWKGLTRYGIQALVQLPRCHREAVLSVVVRADHRQADLDRLVRALAAVTRGHVAA